MARKILSGIYEIVNLVNGKRYIGSAVDLHRRRLQHWRTLKVGKHHSVILQNSWNKYGELKFEFRLIEYCDVLNLIVREQYYLEGFRPEYNMVAQAGSILGFRFTEEQKQKRRGIKRSPDAIQRTAAAHRGMKRSEETRARISAKAKGRKRAPRSQEHRAALSAILSGKRKSADHMAALQAGRLMRVYTDEQRAKISETLKTRYQDGTRSREKSSEHKAKIANTLSGRVLTDQHRLNVAAAMRGKKRGPYTSTI